MLFHKSSEPIRAIIIGGRGSIGAGMIRALEKSNACINTTDIPVESIVCTSRDKTFVEKFNDTSSSSSSNKSGAQVQCYHLDPCNEQQFATFAKSLKSMNQKAPNFIFNATGILHGNLADTTNDSNGENLQKFRPETSMKKLSLATMEMNFRVNTFTTGLSLRYLLAELGDRKEQSAVFATLSAKVGSISDNQTGGWYAYRAAKSATNALVKCASIECKRTHPGWRVLALHPGTVESGLSEPFVGKAKRETLITTVEEYEKKLAEAESEGDSQGTTPYVYWTADMSAGRLFEVMNKSTVEKHSGQLIDYAGRIILP